MEKTDAEPHSVKCTAPTTSPLLKMIQERLYKNMKQREEKKKSKLVLKKDCSTAIFNIFSYELIIFRKQMNDVPYLHVYTENLYSKPFLIMLVIFFHARKISKIGPKVMVGVC